MTDTSADPNRKELLKSAYRKIESLRARLAEVETRDDDPVAVIGMGCRFPGGVEDPESFWRLLSEGLDGTTEIPPDRWNVDAYYDADPDAPNKMYVRRGGFIDNIRGFDPLFFHISPLEAASMDPQQRVLLEVAWEAIENAGYAPDQLAGSRTGVFIGLTAGDFGVMAIQAMRENAARTHTATGISPSIAAGHISYFLGLRGPCMAVDTACSSALTAIHLAADSLRKGESTMALAGAINLILAPDGNIMVCKARMLAPDGHCKTFDAAADGYARSEGCGVLMLKLLSRARADGDRVLAVIRGSAVNQDGRTNGITAPSGNAQREVIQAALAAARVAPNDIDFLETHGTGTSLGDPIEVQALGEVFAAGRPAGRDLVLGAVKSNIGHLEGAAGMAAICKVILALQKGSIPGNLHFETPNPHIPWGALPFSVPTGLTPWRAGGPTRLASVSAFGFSGTNVHMVLEQAPEPGSGAPAKERDHHLLTLSARTPKALLDLASRYIDFLTQAPDTDLGDLCFTASAGRTHFAHRIGVLAPTPQDMKAELERYVNAAGDDYWIIGGRIPARPPNPALLIGRIAAPRELHRQLYASSPVFRAAFDACEAIALELFSIPLLSEALTWPLWTAVSGDGDDPRHRALGFGLAYAMTAQWLDWGPAPVALAAGGREICVAAVTVGAITLADAMRLAVDPMAAGTMAIDWSSPTLPVISADTGRPLSAVSLRRFAEDGFADATKPGRLGRMLDGLREEGAGLLLCGGESGLESEAREYGEAEHGIKIIFAGGEDWRDLLTAFAALYVAGSPPDWGKFEAPWRRRRLALPTYPFQRQECWLHVATPAPARPSRRKPDHPILGRRAHAPQFKDDIVFEAELNDEDQAQLRDHRYRSTAIVAMATMLDMVISAARACIGGDAMLEGVTIEQPLVLPPGQTRLVQTVLTPQPGGGFAFSIVSADLDDPDGASAWRRHCAGTVRAVDAAQMARRADMPRDLPERYQESVDPSWFYDTVAGAGLDYGPAFRLMREIRRADDGVFARLALPPELAASAVDHAAHPGLLDGAIQAMGLCRMADPSPADRRDAYLPVGVDRVTVSKQGLVEIWCHATLRPQNPDDLDTLVGDMTLFAPDGAWIGEIAGIQCRRNAERQLRRELDERRLANWLHETHWEALPDLGTDGTLTGTWLVIADEPDDATAFARHVRDQGGQAILVRPGGAFGRDDSGDYVMPLDSGADYDELLGEVGAAGRVDGVAYFAGGASGPDGRMVDPPTLARRQSGEILQLVQALTRNGVGELGRLALITRGFATPGIEASRSLAAGAIWGLGRVINAELPELNCRLHDLEPALTPADAAQALAIELASSSVENQVALGKAGRSGPRLQRTEPEPSAPGIDGDADSGPVELEIGARGDFRQLRFVPQTLAPPGPGQVRLRVLATALNFRDVLNVLGMYPGDPGALGVECVGEIVAIGPGVDSFAIGDQVLAIPLRGYCTYANAPVEMVFPRPPNLSLPEAATLLVAYMTATYALNHLGHMSAGNRVLIHAAAGGVGLAAVRLAQRAGAEIFATAGSPAKREYLRQLGIPHVMDSRSVDFADEIRAIVGDQGIDLVLNSLTGPAMSESLKLVRAGGSFLEIGKTGVFTPEQAKAINPGASHDVVELLPPFLDSPDLMRGLFEDIVQGLATGALAPLPYRVFPMTEAPQAFRYMAAARHIGKVVVVDRPPGARKAIDPSGTYLITGGLGGLGLIIARGLAADGARDILLVSRRPPDAEAQARIKDIEELGATVRVGCADVGDRAALAEILTANLSPAHRLRGVIHAAGVVDDGMLLFQDESRFSRVMAPKVDGAWNLHELTVAMPLDFFVMFSSGAGLFGNPGQSGYAAASVFLDTLAMARLAAGLPALAVDWGPWAEVGMAARLDERRAKGWDSMGLQSMSPDEGTMIMRMLLAMDRGGQIAVLPIEPGFWRRPAAGRIFSPFLANLVDPARPEPVSGVVVDNAAQHLRDAAPEERLGVMIDIVTGMVMDIFGLDKSHAPSADQNFIELGMDSLLAIQLSNRLKNTFAVAAPATLAFQKPTAREIGEDMLERIALALESPDIKALEIADDVSRAVSDEPDALSSSSAGDLLANLDQLSDSDVEKLLESLELGVKPS
jgi:acyl transferase domain-containing protein/NADPH:quinone reductase-like Zn-dependent oxidoreductase/acyl carrier protein